jgi:hypothetical protein
MPLSELQRKLIRLALDPAAHPGEIQNCAIKLIESWRREGKHPEEIFGDDKPALAAAYQYWAPDYGLCTMRFGKHKEKQFKDIPPSYFRWLLPKLREDLTNPEKAKYLASTQGLIDDIENFLKQY